MRGRTAALSAAISSKSIDPSVDEEPGIYRDEVQDIIGVLADIKMAVFRILRYIEGEDEDEEEEEEGDAPDA